MRSIAVVGTESPALKMATLGHFNVHRAMVTRFVAIKPILWYVVFVGLTVGNIINVSKVSGRPGEVQKFHKRAVAVITGDFHTDRLCQSRKTNSEEFYEASLTRQKYKFVCQSFLCCDRAG